MAGYSQGRSDQLDVPGVLKEHRKRIKNLEAANVSGTLTWEATEDACADIACRTIQNMHFVWCTNDISSATQKVPASGGGTLIADFHPSGGYSPGAVTNDVAAVTGYNTVLGGTFMNDDTWDGDYFTGLGPSYPDAAFSLSARSGMYLLEYAVVFRVSGDSGILYITPSFPAGSPLTSAVLSSPVYPLAFQSNVQLTWTTTILVLRDAASPLSQQGVGIALEQTSGTQSDIVECVVRGTRLQTNLESL